MNSLVRETTAKRAPRLGLGLLARTLWQTVRHSLVVLSVVVLFWLFAFALAAFAHVKGQAPQGLLIATAIPAFFWWVAAGEFLLLRAPASTVALVPGYRRAYAIAIALHLVLTCVLPAAAMSRWGWSFAEAFGAMVVYGGAGALIGQRARTASVLLLALTILAFVLNEHYGPAGAPDHFSAVTVALELGFGTALFAAWWRLGLGAKADQRWHDWLRRVLQMQAFEDAARHAGVIDNRLAYPFARLENRLYHALDALAVRRFSAAPCARSRQLAMLSIGLGRMPARATIATLSVVFIVGIVVFSISSSATGMELLALLMMSFVHPMACTTIAAWRGPESREPHLLWLLPRLDPARNFGALSASMLTRLHLRVLGMSAAGWLVLTYLLDVTPLRVGFGLLWLSLIAVLSAAFSCALLGPLRWQRLTAGAVAYGAPLLGYVVAWSALMRAPGAPLMLALALALLVALLLLGGMRGRLRATVNPFSPA
jgi:hypothetical protein